MPPERKLQASRYETLHYAMFVGKTIARVELAEIEGGFGLVPTFSFTDGTFGQVWSDPEGSGPGWVSLHSADGGFELLPNGLKTGDFKR